MTYAAPSRATLRVGISRDVQDPDNQAFTTDEINDLIMDGIVELNRLRPKEYVASIPLTDSVYEYPLTNVAAIFRVEIWRDGSHYGDARRNYDASNRGWDFFGGTLFIPNWDLDSDLDVLRVWGYSNREMPDDDDDVIDCDAIGERVIRAFAKSDIFQRITADRALYQQWQSQANNTDVSPTQLLGMAQVFRQQWRDLEGRVRLLRRPG